MALIKHAQASSLPKPAIVLDLGDLRRAAEAMETAAREKCRGILDEARAERERILAGAFDEGFAAGRAEGLAKGTAQGLDEGRHRALDEARPQLQNLVRAWSEALQAFVSTREDILLDARGQTLALAMAVAERVTKRAIALDPAIVRDQLAAALELTLKPTRLRIDVNPEDLPIAEQAIPELIARFGPATHAELAPIPTLARGSVVVHTDGGEIDASIETQLNRIVEAVLPGVRPPPDQQLPASTEGAP